MTYLICNLIDSHRHTDRLESIRAKIDESRLKNYVYLGDEILKFQNIDYNMFTLIDPTILEEYAETEQLIIGKCDFECLEYRVDKMKHKEKFNRFLFDFYKRQKYLIERKNSKTKLFVPFSIKNISMSLEICKKIKSFIKKPTISWTLFVGALILITIFQHRNNDIVEEQKQLINDTGLDLIIKRDDDKMPLFWIILFVLIASQIISCILIWCQKKHPVRKSKETNFNRKSFKSYLDIEKENPFRKPQIFQNANRNLLSKFSKADIESLIQYSSIKTKTKRLSEI